MADDFVQPIIEAFVRSAQMQAQAKRDEESKRENLSREQQQKDALKQAREIAEQNFKHQQAQLDIQKEAQKLRQKQLHMQAIQQMQEDISKGTVNPAGLAQKYQDVQPNPENPMMPQVRAGGSITVDDEVLPIGRFQTPAQRVQLLEQEAEAKATPAFRKQKELLEHQERLQREQADAAFSRTEKQADTAYNRAIEVEKMRDASMERIARINAGVRLKAAGSTGVDVGDNVLNDIYLTGTRNLPAGKLGNIISRNAPQGWTPLTRKDSEFFDGIAQVESLFDDARQLSQYSINNPIGAATRYFGIGEAGSAKGKVIGQLGNVARIFGGERGVLTQQDIRRAENLFSNPRLTEGQMIKQLEELHGEWIDKIKAKTSKFPKDQLEGIFTHKNIPSNYLNEQKKNNDPLGIR